jgi:hypothetical protein
MYCYQALLPLLLVLLFPITLRALPTVEVKATAAAAEKGQGFQIFVEITADRGLSNLVVVPIVPAGFLVAPQAVTGLKRIANGESDQTNTVLIEQLESSGSVTVPFDIFAPTIWGTPPAGAGKKKSFYSTRDPRTFAFNIAGTDDAGHFISLTRQISLRYTTTIGFYISLGLLGVVLGYFLKIATQYKDEVVAELDGKQGLEKLKLFLFSIFVRRLPYFLTLLVVGFAALLTLAKDSLPVTSWHQAIALGIALGVLSDEQLISKIK